MYVPICTNRRNLYCPIPIVTAPRHLPASTPLQAIFLVALTAMCALRDDGEEMSFVFQSQHTAHVVCLVSYPATVDMDYQE